MSFAKLSEALDFGVKKDAIRNALLREGFHRRLAMRKPPVTEKNRNLRLVWAQEHVNWTPEQWYQILWTDKTRITGGRHTRMWVSGIWPFRPEPGPLASTDHVSPDEGIKSPTPSRLFANQSSLLR